MKNKFYFLIISVLISFPVFSQETLLIKDLNNKDFMFVQYSQELQESNKMMVSGKKIDVNFYCYKTKSTDTFFSVCSRLCIRQETLALINSIEQTQFTQESKLLYLPTVEGLFITDEPSNTLEMILYQTYKDELSTVPKYVINGKNFYFFQGYKLSNSQRLFFLNPNFCDPLEKSVLTSAFGKRISPISGEWKNHNGIDLASPEGSKVFACRSGVISEIGRNHRVYGNYIIINHSENLSSLYAHLSEICVSQNQVVAAGHIIGKVGTTGLTTGPHLHFEIRQNGKSQNPENYIKIN